MGELAHELSKKRNLLQLSFRSGDLLLSCLDVLVGGGDQPPGQNANRDRGSGLHVDLVALAMVLGDPDTQQRVDPPAADILTRGERRRLLEAADAELRW